MLRTLVIFGILGGVGWYAYRMLMASEEGSAAGKGIAERVPPSVRQAVTTAASKVRAAAPGSQAAAGREHSETGSPAETRAAMMAGMPAVQAPATVTEP